MKKILFLCIILIATSISFQSCCPKSCAAETETVGILETPSYPIMDMSSIEIAVNPANPPALVYATTIVEGPGFVVYQFELNGIKYLTTRGGTTIRHDY